MAKKKSTPSDIVTEDAPVDETKESIELSDDELALEALTDEAVEATPDLAVFRQAEGMIAWTLQNFYKEDGTTRSKRDLRLDPPILRIENSDGESVDFILTRNFSKSLLDTLEIVRLGTFGVKKNRSKWGSFKDALVGSVLENPLKVIVFGLLVVFTVIFMLIS